MKKIFFTSLSSLLFILPNTISNFANLTNHQIGIVQNQIVNHPSNINGKEVKDIADGDEVTPYLRYGNANNRYWIYQTSISKDIFSYKSIEFAQYTNTWASWGNTHYEGLPYLNVNINDYLANRKLTDIENKQMESSYDVNQNSVDWLHVKDCQGSAVAEIAVRFHFTWFYKSSSEEFYFQIGIYMNGETWSSFSGGGIWADLGKQLIFNY